MLLRNAKAYVGGKFELTDVLTGNGVIEAIGCGAKAADTELDLKGDYLLPGFVDVHIHAFMGHDTMNGEADVRAMSRDLRKHGVAAFLPTTMSASAEDTVKALAGIQAVMNRQEPDGAVVLGAHMEAPFLAPSKAGAQVLSYFAKPCEEAWQRFTGGYEGIVRQITMAPEIEGALDFIPKLTAKGIVVSIGHTAADNACTHAAADVGATHVTHTFNAQSPFQPRCPGVPGAALVDDRLYCEYIGDGIHLHPDTVRILYRCKGKDRLVGITDAMEAAGMPDGEYSLGGQAVFVKDGAARLENGTLAGSTLTQIRVLQNLIKFGIPAQDAVEIVTSTPANSIGEKQWGRIQVGAPAVFARFDAEFGFVSTIA